MKLIKKFSIAAFILLALFIAVAYVLPSRIIVNRSIEIKKPVEVVFEQVSNFKNWNNWSPWFNLDNKMEKKYSGKNSGLGAAYSWHSDNNKVGYGSLIINHCLDTNTILIDMNYMENGVAKCMFYFEGDSLSTVVTWNLYRKIRLNPIERYFGLLYNNIVGEEFNNGLLALKKHCELLTN